MRWAKYTAVVFDCDDTVIATAKRRWAALIETAGGFDHVLEEATIRRFWGLPFDQLIANLVPTVEFGAFVEAYKEVMHVQQPEATPGALELLEALSVREVQMDIITSGSRDLIIQDLDCLKLTRYFTGIYGYEQTPFHKPDPRVLTPVLGALIARGHVREGVIYIGDSIRDYQAARGNDLEFIAVTSGLEGSAEFVQAGLDQSKIFESLTDLLKAAEGWESALSNDAY